MPGIVLRISCLIAILGLAYQAAAAWSLRAWRRRGGVPSGRQPPVTLLKPLAGMEPELYQNLRSFCRQEYPDFEIVFGVQVPDDPAIPIVERLTREFPRRDITLVVDPRSIGANRKVGNLANMMRVASHDLLIATDSDIRVGVDYLRTIVAPLLEPDTGMVTVLYAGCPGGSIWSRLGALGVNEGMLPSVLVARRLGVRVFASGATMGLRREVLEAMGGFEAVADDLADDYRLAALARASGRRTVLSPYLVETTMSESSVSELVRHELRWSRTIRALQPAGHAFSWLMLGIPVVIPPMLIGHLAGWTFTFPAAWLVLRWWLHREASLTVGRAESLWLIPLREVLSFVVWVASYSGRQVEWRGQRFAVDRSGRMAPRGAA